MPDSKLTENDFLLKITGIVEENITNEQFGVSELARAIGMSRSNLLRKVKKSTNLSVSQFIRQIRLKNAMELLKESSINISEVSYAVGFSSTSYFTKCFHDFYGYPPGEVGKKGVSLESSDYSLKQNKNRKVVISLIGVLLIIFIGLYVFVVKDSQEKVSSEKSIAVLPFKNDSNDLGNVYIINGLMESVLNNLQKIQDLRVISRTSVEKYRTNNKTIKEIAKELNVNYVIEGSGQKIDDKILLNIQLIEAATDAHLWSEQFERNTSDIFNLQREVAKTIANKIEVFVSPDEVQRIEKTPTNNLVAYDYFLKGYEQFHEGTLEGLEASILSFKKALEHDNKFARAYADIAMAYYYLDFFQSEKIHKEEINYYSDKALLYDAKLAQSLIAKSLYYTSSGDCKLAIPYLEKALEYNPNSALALNFLSDIYTNCLPNTEKYLTHALKGIKLDLGSNDSTSTSYTYLHISNAFVQSGFVDEAEHYINKSLDYNPNNLFSEYLRAYVLYAKDKNLLQTKDRLLAALKKDTTRLDIIQEVGKVFYYMRDYNKSYKYFSKLTKAKETYHLDIYPNMNAAISLVFSKMNHEEQAKKYLDDYRKYVETNTSIYKNLELAMYYSYSGETKEAIEYFRLFSNEKDYHYWTILFSKLDPLFDNIKNTTEFQDIYKNLESKFWSNHKKIRTSLEEQSLI